ncbi:alpha/beta hydrolase [Aestuariibacter halophilus]|uniref:Alpha/beta hydrolase n=1 Tax=Fluctibacter halophilus TaxID=226011 RepID=A0ABS8G5U3_9ALTE|nr:alpha/beta hydrolase [Aestuariibacter halophilus]MCC2615225.1 alpha/beta hydrolase [Aestuariibacter halophilus]
MIYVFSNRNVTNNEQWLGDDFNPMGNEYLRVARLVTGEQLSLEFLTEDPDLPLPSEQVFTQLELDNKPCCLFIHGFNQDLAKNLGKCQEIERFGVNVIAFSWPSNPGPQSIFWKIKEYRRARQNARRSAVALERFFDKFNEYRETHGHLQNIRSLVVHSMGNYLMQSFVAGMGFAQQTAFLDNILLHQADVDSLGHQHWADDLARHSRVMATVNETDDVLDFSDILNPDRLGNTLGNLNSSVMHYFNFGRVPHAVNKHRLWIDDVVAHARAKTFFQQVFSGSKVQTGDLDYDADRNCYHL